MVCWFSGCSPKPQGAGQNLQPSSGETTTRACWQHARRQNEVPGELWLRGSVMRERSLEGDRV